MKRKTAMIGWCLGTALLLAACAAQPRLSGTIRGSTYTSARGEFSVGFPVSAEVGGRIASDTAESVTFRDNWGSRITYSSVVFTAQSSMMSMLEGQGREKALDEFVRRQFGDVGKIHYHAPAREGTVSFIYLRPVGPKTGVAAFIQGRRIYVVETDLLPGVQMLAQGDERSQSEREEWLENRAVELAQSIEVK
ncbi:MAG: hypothetical protein ABSH38_14895 [Verrucomicrobiota bacterium]|jgi:hypothetical protein